MSILQRFLKYERSTTFLCSLSVCFVLNVMPFPPFTCFIARALGFSLSQGCLGLVWICRCDRHGHYLLCNVAGPSLLIGREDGIFGMVQSQFFAPERGVDGLSHASRALLGGPSTPSELNLEGVAPRTVPVPYSTNLLCSVPTVPASNIQQCTQ